MVEARTKHKFNQKETREILRKVFELKYKDMKKERIEVEIKKIIEELRQEKLYL